MTAALPAATRTTGRAAVVSTVRSLLSLLLPKLSPKRNRLVRLALRATPWMAASYVSLWLFGSMAQNMHITGPKEMLASLFLQLVSIFTVPFLLLIVAIRSGLIRRLATGGKSKSTKG